jgi:N-methylhydantoinase A
MYFDGAWHTGRVYEREKLRPGDTFAGPALIAEYTSSTVLPPGAQLTVDAFRNLIIQVDAEKLSDHQLQVIPASTEISG